MNKRKFKIIRLSLVQVTGLVGIADTSSEFLRQLREVRPDLTLPVDTTVKGVSREVWFSADDVAVKVFSEEFPEVGYDERCETLDWRK